MEARPTEPPTDMHRIILSLVPLLLLTAAVPAARAQSVCDAEVTVRPGDTLSQLAVRCRTTVVDLLEANPWIEDPDLIYPGQTLRIAAPVRTTPQPAAPQPGTPQQPRRPSTKPRGDAPPRKTLVVRGRLTDEGVECPALRTADGTLYTLAGDTGGFEAGDDVRVEGTVAEMSFCMQGTTIAVKTIEAAQDGE